MLLVLVGEVIQALLDFCIGAHACHGLVFFYERLFLAGLILDGGQLF